MDIEKERCEKPLKFGGRHSVTGGRVGLTALRAMRSTVILQ
jgi:hypothetical protein